MENELLELMELKFLERDYTQNNREQFSVVKTCENVQQIMNTIKESAVGMIKSEEQLETYTNLFNKTFNVLDNKITENIIDKQRELICSKDDAIYILDFSRVSLKVINTSEIDLAFDRINSFDKKAIDNLFDNMENIINKLYAHVLLYR